MHETRDSGARPPDQTAWLRREVEAWVTERLIQREQAQMILARYGLVAGGESPRSLRQTQMVTLVSIVGAVLVGVGVLVLVGANWETIPRLGRLALLVLATLAFYGSGYRIGYERETWPGLGRALVLIGSLVWLSSIFLVAQMFHLGGGGDQEYSQGLLYGFIGLLPLAYVLRSPLQLALALFVGSAWIFVGWTASTDMDMWIVLRFLPLAPLLYLIGLWHRRFAPLEILSPTYAKYGLALASVSLYILTFEGVLHFGSSTTRMFPPWGTYGGVVAVTALGAGWFAWTAWLKRERNGAYEALACLALAVVTVVLPFLATTGYAGGNWPVMVLANILLLALEIGCVWVGWNRAEPGLINWGLTLFFIHLMTRYFDLFYNMLGSGAAFIGAGALLLLAGVGLERQRRRLLQTMPEGGTA